MPPSPLSSPYHGFQTNADAVGSERSSARSSPLGPGKGTLPTPIEPVNGLQLTTAHDQLSLSFDSDDMRARMTIALEDELHNHPDMPPYLQPTKLPIDTLNSTSPKPCIVPGNALQLIDDDPSSASRSHTPSSVIIIDSDGLEHEHYDDPSAPESTGHDPADTRRPVPRVRFRSRVRITSGLRRGRHGGANPTSTPSSSASGSPSSSISAPLRWQADESSPWGPLGNRLNAYARANGWKRAASLRRTSDFVHNADHRPQGVGVGLGMGEGAVDERTPLNGRRKARITYVEPGLLSGPRVVDDERARLLDDEEGADSGEALRAAALERDKEAVFGSWPWRIFNRHWWWYHAEPVLCGCCADDPEYDDDP